jgi:hypothetical protein
MDGNTHFTPLLGITSATELFELRVEQQGVAPVMVLSWHAAQSPPSERENLIDALRDSRFPTEGGELQARLKEIAGVLIARKQVQFCRYTWKIITFALTDTASTSHLTVASPS